MTAAVNLVRWAVEDVATGMPVASGSAPTEAAANREMMHYVIQYAQDGHVKFWMRQNRKTLLQGDMGMTHKTLSFSSLLKLP